MSKNTIFKYVGDFMYDEHFTPTYEAKFELDNDGTPDTRRFLIVRVHCLPDTNIVKLMLESHPIKKIIDLGEFETKNFEDIANLLYPVAKIEIVKKIVLNK